MNPNAPLRIAVLLSGSGRTLENLLRGQDAGRLAIEFTKVIASRKDVRGIEVATAAKIPCEVLARKSFATDETFSRAITDALTTQPFDVIVMAGFLSLYLIPNDWLGKVINIHPSLLPLFGGKGFYGHHVHQAVIASGMRVSGCTVHYVDNDFDRGPIIHQRTCPVLPDDDADRLAARVFKEECEALPDALEMIRRQTVRFDRGRVVFSATPKSNQSANFGEPTIIDPGVLP